MAAGRHDRMGNVTGQPVIHGSFTVEVDIPAPPERVFSFYAESELRRRWFRIPGGDSHHELDFREGGHEVSQGTFAPSGVLEHLEHRSAFIDIVPGERIVYSYSFALDGDRRWVSLVTVSLGAAWNGTVLSHHEDFAFLFYVGDGAHELAHLKGGTRLLMNALAVALEAPA